MIDGPAGRLFVDDGGGRHDRAAAGGPGADTGRGGGHGKHGGGAGHGGRGGRADDGGRGRRSRNAGSRAHGEIRASRQVENHVPVVFLHSLAGCAAQWTAQLEHLRPQRRAIALELRGHGRSGPPADDDYGIPAYVADVDAAVDALGLERFALVGHSMGAAVAAAYAAGNPDRAAGLLLVDGAQAREEPTPDEAAWLDALRGDRYPELIEAFWTTILTGSRPSVRDRVLADLRATPMRTVAESFQRLIAHDPVPDVRAYPGPKALVLSDVGNTPTATHRHVEGLDYTLIGDTGHWLQLDRPDAFNDVLDAFLERAGGPALEFHPLTLDRWRDVEALFGERGACGGCWCMYWRRRRSEFEAGKGDANRRAFREIVAAGEPAPGILAYIDERPIGWCAIAPREDYPRFEASRILKPVDETPVWSVSCFFVAKPFRRRGASVPLLRAAVEFAARHGATAIEGYPTEPGSDAVPAAFAWTGFAGTFRDAGFVEVARRSERRPIMRYTAADPAFSGNS